jgi:hypothetical protein
MGARRAGSEIEVAADAVFVMMILRMQMFTLMNVRVAVHGPVRVPVAVLVGIRHRRIVRMGVVLAVIVRMAMHRAVRMHMEMFMALAGDLRAVPAASAYRTHRRLSSLVYSISISRTRISVPALACTR